jgi:threonine/homoserine/homoserine lactone efflux protein
MGSFSWLAGFLLVALVVTLTPGPATAMVIRVSARDGRPAALSTVGGHSIGVLAWGVLSAVGVSSLILASDVAYGVLRVAGAIVLIWLGIRTWWLTRRSRLVGAGVVMGSTALAGDFLASAEVESRADTDLGVPGSAGMDTGRPAGMDSRAPAETDLSPSSESSGASWWGRLRSGWVVGLVTSVSNPKLAVFFVALFPQFLRPGEAVLPAALTMAALIVVMDLIWFSVLAYLVERAAVIFRPRMRRVLERVTGSVMIALGLRLAVEAR